MDQASSGALDFTYGAGVAGSFEGSTFPRTPGRYRYEPYRSGSHLMMQNELATAGHVVCQYVDAGRTVRFSVVGCPDVGELELADFVYRAPE